MFCSKSIALHVTPVAATQRSISFAAAAAGLQHLVVSVSIHLLQSSGGDIQQHAATGRIRFDPPHLNQWQPRIQIPDQAASASAAASSPLPAALVAASAAA